MSQAEQTRLLEILHPRDAADLLEDIPELQAVDLIEDVPAETAAVIIQEMHSDEQVDLLGHFDAKSAAAILEQMPSEKADQLRQWLSYPSHSAGGLMVREYLSYSDLQKVADVLDDLREGGERYAEYDVQYAYVVSDVGTLTGVLPLRDLLLAPKDQPLKEIMRTEPVRVGLDAPLDQLEQLFDRHEFFGLPVVDEMDRLAGVVQRADMEEAATDVATKVYLASTGIVGGEELRSMPLFSRAFRRLSWLSTNVVLNIIAAVIGCAAWLWQGNPYLGLVVGGSLAVNTLAPDNADDAVHPKPWYRDALRLDGPPPILAFYLAAVVSSRACCRARSSSASAPGSRSTGPASSRISSTRSCATLCPVLLPLAIQSWIVWRG